MKRKDLTNKWPGLFKYKPLINGAKPLINTLEPLISLAKPLINPIGGFLLSQLLSIPRC